MTIVVDIKSILPGNNGISKYFTKTLQFWISNNKEHQFVLVYPNIDNKFTFPDNTNVVIKKIKYNYTNFNYLNILIYNLYSFNKIVKKIKPDLIFSPYHDVLLPKKFKNIITIHDLCFYKLKSIYKFKIRFFYNYILKKNIARSRKILTTSSFVKNEIAKTYNYDINNIEVVPNPFNLEFEIINYNLIDTSKFNILYHGGVEKRKNLYNLFELIYHYSKVNTQIIFYLTGFESDYNEFNLRKLNNIIYLGKLTENKLNYFLNNIDLILYPSICEGFGRPVIESIIHKKPIICYDLELYREFNHPYIFYFNNNENFIKKVDFVFYNYISFDISLYNFDNKFLQLNCNLKFLEFIKAI